MISSRDAFYDRTTDYGLFLLGLATAPWAGIVTHFIAALSLLLLTFKSWLPFKAVPFLLLLATTWFEIVMHFMTGHAGYVLFLLGLATAPWAGIVTHFIAALSLLLLTFKSWLPFKAVPFLLLLPTTWFEIVMHFMQGLWTTSCSFLGCLQRLGLKC